MKEEKKPKNCGCGQDPCITYGKKKEKVDEACWKGYKAYGMKKKGGKMVPNCKPVGSVKKEEVENVDEKIKYDKSGSSMDYFLGADPKKTEYYKKNAKKKIKKEEVIPEAKVDKKLPDYKRATARDKRYGNPHGSHALGGGIRKDRRADHEAVSYTHLTLPTIYSV